MPKKHYVMLDELHINPKIASFRQLDAAITKTGLAFDAKTARGVLLVTCGRITSHHEASVCVVADSRREVDALLDRFLSEFADEERKHFVHSRSNTPISPSRLGDSGTGEDTEVIHPLLSLLFSSPLLSLSPSSDLRRKADASS